MPNYRITKDEYGGGYTVTEKTETDPKVCIFCCIGLIIASIIAYIVILICGSDPTAGEGEIGWLGPLSYIFQIPLGWFGIHL